ncbi:MAG: sigma-54 dependent transcriptional regulator [Nitrospiraceae bacterium]|nr:sigma-54 dependent transcriptional regulator [Nitrospiraceae bacterium]
MTQTILIVDDNRDMTRFLERLIRNELKLETFTADSAEAALLILEENIVHCVLADMKMPGMDGMELLQIIKKKDATLPVIIMTAYGAVETAVESMKEGAYDFITKPFEEERLLHTVRRALEHQHLLQRNTDLERRIREKEKETFFVGESPRMKELTDTIKLVARTEVTVLITGETGTGKELAARMIHSLSNRTGKPFVVVNCPAIPENILESELFGYRKGAFTGANSDREGLFQTAEGGTLFLDEIGDISSSLQAKLLRVLQERELKPLGDTTTRRVDVRVVAATNRDLEGNVAAGLFRSDLYYRLNVVSVQTPPLRDIPEDIPLIAYHFLSLFCGELGLEQRRLTEEAIQFLVSRQWKGNARELQNEIKRAVIFSKNNLLAPGDFGNSAELLTSPNGTLETDGLDYREARKKVLAAFNIEYISSLLRRTEGNVSLAAQSAGIERQSLQHLMRKYGINSALFRKEEEKNKGSRDQEER